MAIFMVFSVDSLCIQAEVDSLCWLCNISEVVPACLSSCPTSPLHHPLLLPGGSRPFHQERTASTAR